MRIALTGTPGTGKTSAAKILKKKYRVVHLNKLIKEKNLSKGVDEERDSVIADLKAIEKHLPQKALIDSHFSHLLEVDKAIVLRCHPDKLKKRLRNKEEKEIKENQMAEAIDKILIEAINNVPEVHEIDTTKKTKSEVADQIESIIEGKNEKKPGKTDWTKWLMRQT